MANIHPLPSLHNIYILVFAMAAISFSDKEPTVLAEARKRFEAVCADPADPTACVSDFRVPVFKIVLRASKDGECPHLYFFIVLRRDMNNCITVLHEAVA